MKLFVMGAFPYFDVPSVRETCHAIKSGDAEAIAQQARRLEPFVTSCTILIPVPGHMGRAIAMRDLAGAIAARARHNGKLVVVADLMECEPHKSLNELKHDGRWPAPGDVVMRCKNRLARGVVRLAEALGFKVRLVDNVVDSGVTAEACYKVIGPHYILAIGRTENWRRNPDIREMVTTPAIELFYKRPSVIPFGPRNPSLNSQKYI